MQLTFIGSGDAFGSGGRLNTCFHVAGNSVNFLIDCGASSLVGLKAKQIALNDIQAIFCTHFHADHFGGIPFFMLDAQFFSKRTEPLTIVGPRGLLAWYERVMEVSFPGSLSDILCVRHSMSTRSMNATQDEDNRCSGQGGAAAILGRSA